ncbi:MAG: DUF5058 family protein [Clostridia bacterium]|nr:DUF5058 family protein [Clostridia bacterium]
MEYVQDHPIIFVFAGIVILAVLLQAVFFLIRALKRAKEKGMDKSVIRKTIISSLTFTIAPAVSILIAIVSLSKKLGIALPWLRLSVIGSLSYETIAAGRAADAVGNSLASSEPFNAQQFVTVAFVMTIGIMMGIILMPIIGKKLSKGMQTLRNRDSKWGDLFVTALFMGMISAFLGFVFADVQQGLGGWIPVFVFLSAAALMAIFGLVKNLTGWKWIEDYALPVSMVGAMALAIPITNWVVAAGGVVL